MHFPAQLLRLGPLHNQWLFRFESKNNSFKNFKFKNFINLPLSMAKHHQLAHCYSFMNSAGERCDKYLYTGHTVKEGHQVNIDEKFPTLPPNWRNAVGLTCNDDVLYETGEMAIYGLKYKNGACLLLSWEGSLPIFGEIISLLVHERSKFCICKKLETQFYKWTCNAYKVEDTMNLDAISFDTLQNKWPLPKYQVGVNSFITN